MTKSIHTQEYEALAQWLKKSRENASLTMDELGKKLGKVSSFVAKTEQKDRRLDVVEYVKYCRTIGIDPHDGIDLIENNSLSDSL